MPRKTTKKVAERNYNPNETSLPTPRVTRSQSASARGSGAYLKPHVVHSGKAEAEKKTSKPPRDVLLNPGAILNMADLVPERVGMDRIFERINKKLVLALSSQKPKRTRKPLENLSMIPDEQTNVPDYRAFSEKTDTTSPTRFLPSFRTFSAPSTPHRKRKQTAKGPLKVLLGSGKRSLSPEEELVSETPFSKRRRLDNTVSALSKSRAGATSTLQDIPARMPRPVSPVSKAMGKDGGLSPKVKVFNGRTIENSRRQFSLVLSSDENIRTKTLIQLAKIIEERAPSLSCSVFREE